MRSLHLGTNSHHKHRKKGLGEVEEGKRGINGGKKGPDFGW